MYEGSGSEGRQIGCAEGWNTMGEQRVRMAKSFSMVALNIEQRTIFNMKSSIIRLPIIVCFNYTTDSYLLVTTYCSNAERQPPSACLSVLGFDHLCNAQL